MEKRVIIEPDTVGTTELLECFFEGHTPESTMEFYDISKEEYERVKNSNIYTTTKIGKKSPLYEGDNQ